MTNEICRETIQAAMQRFDRELRGSPEWAGWESRPGLDLVAQWEERLYPIKQIGIFAGIGKAARDAEVQLRALKFDLVHIYRLLEGAARTFVEQFTLPDPDVRRQYLSLLADSIVVVDSHTEHWWVTLKASKKAKSEGTIWLNVGTFYRQAAERPLIWLTFDDHAFAGLDLPHLKTLGCTVRPHAYHEKITDDKLNEIAFGPAAWDRTMPHLRQAHLESLERISGMTKRVQPSAPGGHSPGLLAHMSGVLNRPIPQPGWILRRASRA